ncbi:uncharacterized protein LOC135470060 [Liolophura sinensis]|uniref:uncharacterized protein LOC135470060 n=1 Tax=Liolophura sinensis TaxID=3198878 RepID=UPI003158AF07
MEVPVEFVSHDQTKTEIQMLGYSYSHLDKNGRLSEKRTCFLTILYASPDFIDNRRLRQDRRLYFSYFRIKLNTPLIDPRSLLYKKIWLEEELVHVGNTSFIINSLLKSPDRRNTLAIAKSLSVIVDKETHKKRQLPSWFKEKFGHIKQEPVKFEIPEVPRHWNCKVKISHNDIDLNKHANFSAYISYCQDAVYKHQVQQSNLSWFNRLGVEEVEQSYLGEAMEGEELSLYVQQTSSPGAVFLVSVEKDGVIIVKTRLVYTSALSPGLTSQL